MGHSTNELRNAIKGAVEPMLRQNNAVTVFAACNVAQSEKFFVQANFVKGKWCYTKLDGTPVVEGVDFAVCN